MGEGFGGGKVWERGGSRRGVNVMMSDGCICLDFRFSVVGLKFQVLFLGWPVKLVDAESVPAILESVRTMECFWISACGAEKCAIHDSFFCTIQLRLLGVIS
jgi:hypothetical protein